MAEGLLRPRNRIEKVFEKNLAKHSAYCYKIFPNVIEFQMLYSDTIHSCLGDVEVAFEGDHTVPIVTSSNHI